MASIPGNLLRLHEGEEALYAMSLGAIGEVDEASDHLAMTERVMDLFDVLRQQEHQTDDARALCTLGLRVFNDFATAWKLMASGYYQAAALILRDVVETTWLVNFFYLEPNQIEAWRKSDHKARTSIFSPKAIRKALDRHAGHTHSRRDEIYFKFCNLAAHPTVEGFTMLRPLGMEARNGPFYDFTALKAVLEEMGMLAPQAGYAFCVYLDLSTPKASVCAHSFLKASMIYANKYLGLTYSENDIAEIDRIYGIS